MKRFTETQQRILTALSDLNYHRGATLGSQCGLSRTAIWKQLNALKAMHVPIAHHPKQGYRLCLPLLNEDAIRGFGLSSPIEIQLFASIDSTNRFLKEAKAEPHLVQLCCAEQQTAGRGRLGRTWYSPFAENIYCSSRWAVACDWATLSGLSLVVSLAVIALLEPFNLSEALRVKWPNDLFWHDKKLCGNLIDVIAESNGYTDLIIGVGLNVNSLTAEHPDLEKPWCSLREILGSVLDRNQLIASLITHLNRSITQFIAHGFAGFLDEWNRVDYLAGRRITVTRCNESLTGLVLGVDNGGHLLLLDDHEVIHTLSSGDTSLATTRY